MSTVFIPVYLIHGLVPCLPFFQGQDISFFYTTIRKLMFFMSTFTYVYFFSRTSTLSTFFPVRMFRSVTGYAGI